MEKNKKAVILAVAGFLVLALLLAMAWLWLRPGAMAGEKTIHVTVVTEGNSGKTVDIHTKAEYLRQALEQESLIAGEESALGLYVKTVDGVTANESKQEWWRFTKGGEETAGVDSTPIKDGDSFEITLTTGWDSW